MNDIVGANKELRIAFAKLPTGIEVVGDVDDMIEREEMPQEAAETKVDYNVDNEHVLVKRMNTLPALRTYRPAEKVRSSIAN